MNYVMLGISVAAPYRIVYNSGFVSIVLCSGDDHATILFP